MISPDTLRSYLHSHSIDESHLGGSLNAPVSTAERRDASFPALYFVIHDTSFPNYRLMNFPSDINTPEWTYNDLSEWNQGDKSVAHVFINRAGMSLTAIDFSVGWRATKFEMRLLGVEGRGRFLHVENVQPRKSAEAGPPGNDAVAPDPGFTEEQLRRLALVYVAASVRSGKWLIPAFHAVLDVDFSDAHDDPQHFDLKAWATYIEELLIAVRDLGGAD